MFTDFLGTVPPQHANSSPDALMFWGLAGSVLADASHTHVLEGLAVPACVPLDLADLCFASRIQTEFGEHFDVHVERDRLRSLSLVNTGIGFALCALGELGAGMGDSILGCFGL
jgi:hypothetical protein